MDIKGKVVSVAPVDSGQGKNGVWHKQSFVIETGGDYPKKICFTLWGEEKINKYDLVIGLVLTVYFELESREYNGRWYTEAKAWKIESDGNIRQEAKAPASDDLWAKPSSVGTPVVSSSDDDDTSNLPF